MNRDCQLIYENYLNSKISLSEIEDRIRKIKEFLPKFDISNSEGNHIQIKFFDLVARTLNNLEVPTKKHFIQRLIDQKLLPEDFWNYALDNRLLGEAYKPINKAEYKYPMPPKFKIGDIVLIKKYTKSEFIGDYNSTAKRWDPTDWKKTEYKGVLGKIHEIKCFPAGGTRPPSYYYDIIIEDKRYPELVNNFSVICAEYEIKRTQLTVSDTDSMNKLLDI